MEQTRDATATGTTGDNGFVKAVLDRLEEWNVFTGVERERYSCDVETAMAAVTAIGRRMDPRFTIDGHNGFAFTNIVRWALADPAAQCLSLPSRQIVQADLNKGVYLAGGTGRGKTWCLNVIRSFVGVCGMKITSGTHGEPLRWRNVHVRDICDAYMHAGTVAEFVREPVLCVQDLGSEPSEMVYMGTRNNPVGEVIERRGDIRAAVTLFTSNIGLGPGEMEKIAARYGDRVASRLIQMCNYYELTGRDRRR